MLAVSTPFPKKAATKLLAITFSNLIPIFKILSLLKRGRIFPTKLRNIFHHTLSMFVHYLGKVISGNNHSIQSTWKQLSEILHNWPRVNAVVVEARSELRVDADDVVAGSSNRTVFWGKFASVAGCDRVVAATGLPNKVLPKPSVFVLSPPAVVVAVVFALYSTHQQLPVTDCCCGHRLNHLQVTRCHRAEVITSNGSQAFIPKELSVVVGLKERAKSILKTSSEWLWWLVMQK